jgi:hypothetical protein
MPPRYKNVPLWKTKRTCRKGMILGYNKIPYNQRNKNETIISVIKILFGENIVSRLTRMQNRGLIFRSIAYNTYRIVKLVVLTMVSSEP